MIDEIRDYWIYQTVDPRDDLPFYVGYTGNPLERMKQHIQGDTANPASYARIKEIKALGLTPRFEELEHLQGTVREALARETYWIRAQRDAGAPLVNMGKPLETTDRDKRTFYLKKTVAAQFDAQFNRTRGKLADLTIDKADYLEACLTYAIAHTDEIEAMLQARQ